MASATDGYLDAASAEPLHPSARAALLEALDDGWADPARLHREGRRAQRLLDQARESVAAEFGCHADEVSFTSSGTQAVHLAVLGAVQARQSAARGPGHLVASAVEHSAVLNAADWLHRVTGTAVSLTGVDGLGRADVAEFAAAIRQDRTLLACLQSANHEVGTIQPVAEAADESLRARVPLLVDAGASAGRLPIPAGWSLLTASARKWGGPPGVGVLAVRRNTRWREPFPADEREGRRVPGFPNVPEIVAAAVALTAMGRERAELDGALRALVARIRAAVPKRVSDAVVHGDPDARLPHIVTFSCLYIDGEAVVTELDRAGFSVSSGSACVADTRQPSHVLAAMGALTHGNVRVSLPRTASDRAVSAFLDALPPIVARIRETVRAGSPGPPDHLAQSRPSAATQEGRTA
ncbi:MAG: aminotransferase class V-fold PLP-dependent enzyme [Actinobacteria bacterium]|nr:aminotransferase class V-fold PLP-dependent enzyme [Actinomycetota bacterium]